MYKKTSIILIAICSLVLSCTPSFASDVGLTDVDYVVATGLDSQSDQLPLTDSNSDFIVTDDFELVPFTKGESKVTDKAFYYSDKKVTNFAKMQNSNFDRVWISYDL